MIKMTCAMALLDFATEIITNGTADFNGFSASDYIEKLEALKREKEGVKAEILEVLSDEGKQCKDIARAVGVTNQKCLAVLKQMIEAGLAEKYTEKKVTYFKRA